MTNWDNLAGAAVGLMGVAIVVKAAGKTVDMFKETSHKVKSKGDKVKW